MCVGTNFDLNNLNNAPALLFRFAVPAFISSSSSFMLLINIDSLKSCYTLIKINKNI